MPRRAPAPSPRRLFRTPFEVGISPFPEESSHPNPALGFDLGALAVAFGANTVVPGSGPVVAAAQGSGLLDSVFHGGAATDAKRKARVQWVIDLARQGSVTAAKLILEAPDHVAGNEDPMWQAAVQLIPPDVLNEAYADPRQVWVDGMPEFYNNPSSPLYRQMMAEASAPHGVVGSVTSGVTGLVNTIAQTFGIQPGNTPVMGPNGQPVAGAKQGVPGWLVAAGVVGIGALLFRR